MRYSQQLQKTGAHRLYDAFVQAWGDDSMRTAFLFDESVDRGQARQSRLFRGFSGRVHGLLPRHCTALPPSWRGTAKQQRLLQVTERAVGGILGGCMPLLTARRRLRCSAGYGSGFQWSIHAFLHGVSKQPVHGHFAMAAEKPHRKPDTADKFLVLKSPKTPISLN